MYFVLYVLYVFVLYVLSTPTDICIIQIDVKTKQNVHVYDIDKVKQNAHEYLSISTHIYIIEQCGVAVTVPEFILFLIDIQLMDSVVLVSATAK